MIFFLTNNCILQFQDQKKNCIFVCCKFTDILVKIMTETREEIRGEISVSPLVIEWMVDYFTLSKGLNGRFRSPAFHNLDGMWHLLCCQQKGNNADYISLYLRKENSVISQYCVTYQLGIRGANDGSVYTSYHGDQIIDTAGNYCMGIQYFVLKSTFTKDKLLIAPRGGMVNFFCILQSKAITAVKSQTVRFEGTSISTQTREDDLKTGDLQDHEEKLLSIPTGTDKLVKDLKDLLLNEQDCDVTIKINERDIRAHRSILGGRSPVFLSMFTHDTIERKTGIVTIEDCDPDIFHTFLIFLYTSEVQEFTPDNVYDLYVVAEKYDVQEVKLKCIEYMIKYLSIDNFCDSMCHALKYKENPLINAATDFFLKNAKKIIVTVQWQSFLKEYPLECNELNIKLLARVIPE